MKKTLKESHQHYLRFIMLENNIVLHCHIFKNGGTTIDNMLTRNFGNKAVIYEPPAGQNFLLSEVLLDMVERTGKNQIASISSHRLGLPVPQHERIKFIPLVMIREPLDRLGSMYSFYKRHHADHINHECLLAQKEPFQRFVEILMESNLDSSFINLQCQFFLGNYSPPKHPNEATWPTILDNLNAVSCLGLLEMFDESMVLWEEYLRHFFPLIDLSYVKMNISTARSTSFNERLQSLSDELGEALVCKFKNRNQLEYQLYNLVKSKLTTAINTTPFFAEKLSAFKAKISPGTIILDDPTKFIAEHKIACASCNQDTSIDITLEGKQFCLPRIDPKFPPHPAPPLTIIGCSVFDQETGSLLQIVRHKQKLMVIIVAKVLADIAKPIVGITLENDKNEIVFAMNSLHSPTPISTLRGGSMASFGFRFDVPPLNSGSYTITPAFASGSQEDHVILHQKKDAAIFFVPKMIECRMPGHLYINDYSLINDQKPSL